MNNKFFSKKDIETSVIENINNIFSEKSFFKIHKDERYDYGIKDISYESELSQEEIKKHIKETILKHEKRIEYLNVEFDEECKKILILTIKIANSNKTNITIKYEY